MAAQACVLCTLQVAALLLPAPARCLLLVARWVQLLARVRLLLA
jgi:hypothetical protein